MTDEFLPEEFGIQQRYKDLAKFRRSKERNLHFYKNIVMNPGNALVTELAELTSNLDMYKRELEKKGINPIDSNRYMNAQGRFLEILQTLIKIKYGEQKHITLEYRKDDSIPVNQKKYQEKKNA